MSILDNLHRVHAAVILDKLKPAAERQHLAEKIGALAVQAITDGIKSDAWKEYMKLFAVNKEQLERLTVVPVPATEQSYLPRLRAYVVSNAVCASETTVFTADKVTGEINGGASDEVDQAFVDARAVKIPNV